MSKTSKRYVSLLLAFIMMFTTIFTSISFAEQASEIPDVRFDFKDVTDGTTSSAAITTTGTSIQGNITSEAALKATLTGDITVSSETVTSGTTITFTKKLEVSFTSSTSIKLKMLTPGIVTVYTTTNSSETGLELKSVDRGTFAYKRIVTNNAEAKNGNVLKKVQFEVTKAGDYTLSSEAPTEALSDKVNIHGIDINYNFKDPKFNFIINNETVKVSNSSIQATINESSFISAIDETNKTITVRDLTQVIEPKITLLPNDEGYGNAVSKVLSGNKLAITYKQGLTRQNARTTPEWVYQENKTIEFTLVEEVPEVPAPNFKVDLTGTTGTTPGSIEINTAKVDGTTQTSVKVLLGGTEVVPEEKVVTTSASVSIKLKASDFDALKLATGVTVDKTHSGNNADNATIDTNVENTIKVTVTGENSNYTYEITITRGTEEVPEVQPPTFDVDLKTANDATSTGGIEFRTTLDGTTTKGSITVYVKDGQNKVEAAKNTLELESTANIPLEVSAEHFTILLNVATAELKAGNANGVDLIKSTDGKTITVEVAATNYKYTINITGAEPEEPEPVPVLPEFDVDLKADAVATTGSIKFRTELNEDKTTKGSIAVYVKVGENGAVAGMYQDETGTASNIEVSAKHFNTLSTATTAELKAGNANDVELTKSEDGKTITVKVTGDGYEYTINITGAEPEEPEPEPEPIKPKFVINTSNSAITINVDDLGVTATDRNSNAFESTLDAVTSTASIKIDADYFDANIKDLQEADFSVNAETAQLASIKSYDDIAKTLVVSYGKGQTYTVVLERKDKAPEPSGPIAPKFIINTSNSAITINVDDLGVTATDRNSNAFESTLDTVTSTASIKIDADYFDANIKDLQEADFSVNAETAQNAAINSYSSTVEKGTLVVSYGKGQTYTVVFERKEKDMDFTIKVGDININVSPSSIKITNSKGETVVDTIDGYGPSIDVTIPAKYGVDSWANEDFTISNSKYTVSYDSTNKVLTVKEGEDTKLTINFKGTAIDFAVTVPETKDLEIGNTFIASFDITGNTGFNNATFDITYDEKSIKPVVFAAGEVDDSEWIQGSNPDEPGAFISSEFVDKQVALAKDGKLRIANVDWYAKAGEEKLYEITNNGTVLKVKFEVVDKVNSKIGILGTGSENRIFNYSPQSSSSYNNIIKTNVLPVDVKFDGTTEPSEPIAPKFIINTSNTAITVDVNGNIVTATDRNSNPFVSAFDVLTSTATIKIDADYFDANIKDLQKVNFSVNAEIAQNAAINSYSSTVEKGTLVVSYGKDQNYKVVLERKDKAPEPDKDMDFAIKVGDININVSPSSIKITNSKGETVVDTIENYGTSVEVTIPGKYGVDSWTNGDFTISNSKYTVSYDSTNKVLTVKQGEDTKLTINFKETAIDFAVTVPETKDLETGDTFIASFDITGNTGFNNATFDITYDEKSIKPVVFTAGEVDDSEWIQGSNPDEPGAFISKEFVNKQAAIAVNGKLRIANVNWYTKAGEEALYEITDNGTVLKVKFEVVDKVDSKIGILGIGIENRIFNYSPQSSSDFNNAVKTNVLPADVKFDGTTEPSEPIAPKFIINTSNTAITVDVNGNAVTATDRNSNAFESAFDAVTSTAAIKIDADYFDANIKDLQKVDFSVNSEIAQNAAINSYSSTVEKGTLVVSYGKDQNYTVVLERKDKDEPEPEKDMDFAIKVGDININVSPSSIKITNSKGETVVDTIENYGTSVDVTIPAKYGVDSWTNGDFTISNSKYTVSYDSTNKVLTVKEGEDTKLTINFKETAIDFAVTVPETKDLEIGNTFIASFDITGNTGFNNATFDITYDEKSIKPVVFATGDVDDSEWIQGSNPDEPGAFVSEEFVNQQVALAKDGKLRIANVDWYTKAGEEALYEITDNGTLLKVKFEVVDKVNSKIGILGTGTENRIFNYSPQSSSSYNNIIKTNVLPADVKFDGTIEPSEPIAPKFIINTSNTAITVDVNGNIVTATDKDSNAFESAFDVLTSTAAIKIDADYFDANIKDLEKVNFSVNAETAQNAAINSYSSTVEKGTLVVSYGKDQNYTVVLERNDKEEPKETIVVSEPVGGKVSEDGIHSYRFTKGSTVTVNFKLTGNNGIANTKFAINYDSKKLKPIASTEYGKVEDYVNYTSDGQSKFLVAPSAINAAIAAAAGGKIEIDASTGSLIEATNDGILFSMTFEVVTYGEHGISVEDLGTTDAEGVKTEITFAPVDNVKVIPMKGDYDGDGMVTAKDKGSVVSHLANPLKVVLSEDQKYAMDLDEDGMVTAKDKGQIVSYLANPLKIKLPDEE